MDAADMMTTEILGIGHTKTGGTGETLKTLNLTIDFHKREVWE